MEYQKRYGHTRFEQHDCQLWPVLPELIASSSKLSNVTKRDFFSDAY